MYVPAPLTLDEWCLLAHLTGDEVMCQPDKGILGSLQDKGFITIPERGDPAPTCLGQMFLRENMGGAAKQVGFDRLEGKLDATVSIAENPDWAFFMRLNRVPESAVHRISDLCGKIGVLEWIAVHDGHEGKGNGRKIMEEAMSSFHREGCDLIALQVIEDDYFDLPFFYSKFGFERVDVSARGVEELMLAGNPEIVADVQRILREECAPAHGAEAT